MHRVGCDEFVSLSFSLFLALSVNICRIYLSINQSLSNTSEWGRTIAGGNQKSKVLWASWELNPDSGRWKTVCDPLHYMPSIGDLRRGANEL